jgi:hypothetical protein
MHFVKTLNYIVVTASLLAIAGCGDDQNSATTNSNDNASAVAVTGSSQPVSTVVNTSTLNSLKSLLRACLSMPENQNRFELETELAKISGNEQKLTDADILNGASLQAGMSVEIPIRKKGDANWSQAKLYFDAEDRKKMVRIIPDTEMNNDISEGWLCESPSGLAPAEAVKEMKTNPRHKYLQQGGLTWMPVTFTDVWSDAKSYCNIFNGSGQIDWRLPTIQELANLQTSGLQTDQGWADGIAWSSTAGGFGYHYGVGLGKGDKRNSFFVDTDTDKYVACVR